ncbi:MAG TPA: helix-turn-helix domain-containing protein [Nitrososphaerales archaeon]|nr:helix-turn-helix domain-containing protein [Nitrososphaerales archaeon]
MATKEEEEEGSRAKRGYGADGLDEQTRILANLGLTRIQARVYLHLFHAGEQSARAIVDSLRIDRVDVYRALQSLQGHGLVEVNLGNPNKYSASQSSTALKLLLKRKEDEFESLKGSAAHLEKILNASTSKARRRESNQFGKVEEEQFYKLKRGYAVVDTILKIEGQAKKEVRKVVNRKGMGYHVLFGIEEVEKKLANKGVKIRLITDQRSPSIYYSYSKIASVKYAGDLTNSLRYIIVDDSLIMLSMAPNVTDEKDSVALLTNNVTLIQALSSFYDRIWNSIRR